MENFTIVNICLANGIEHCYKGNYFKITKDNLHLKIEFKNQNFELIKKVFKLNNIVDFDFDLNIWK